jgi:hypothetical protein
VLADLACGALPVRDPAAAVRHLGEMGHSSPTGCTPASLDTLVPRAAGASCRAGSRLPGLHGGGAA